MSAPKRKRPIDEEELIASSINGDIPDDIDFSVLDALEKEGQVVEELDSKKVKKLVLSFEKKLKDNLESRIKYIDQPEKFMDSEVELDEEIKKLSVLAGAPQFYPEIVKLNVVGSIVGLLSHENTDISLDVVSLLNELTDEDAIGEYDDEAAALVDSLLENNVLELLVQNLSRLDEEDNDEASGVHNTLGVLENIVEEKPEIAETVCERTKLLTWLLKRILKKEFDSNKLYASEILSIFLQNSPQNQQRVGKLNGVDILLQSLASYKSRNPKSIEEEELLENLFDALCSVLMLPENKEKFVKAEGVELMVIIMKNKQFAFFSAVKALDFALTRCPAACERFVDVLGLSLLFSIFMGKIQVKRKIKAEALKLQEELEERTISILASLFGGLGKGSRRDRLLSKFSEKEFEKLDRLMEFYLRYSDRVIEEERRQTEMKKMDDLELDVESKYLMKLEMGLFTLEMLAMIFAHIWSVDLPGSRERIDLLLRQQKLSRDDLKSVLQEYYDNIGDVDGEEEREQRKKRITKLLELL